MKTVHHLKSVEAFQSAPRCVFSEKPAPQAVVMVSSRPPQKDQLLGLLPLAVLLGR